MLVLFESNGVSAACACFLLPLDIYACVRIVCVFLVSATCA